MKKVAIYCRLSDEDKDKANYLDESQSIQNQKMLLTKYAIDQGWGIYKIYSDDDYSGLDIDRPEFTQMLSEARDGKFDIILCKHQSRFSRNMETIEKYLHNKFQQWSIRFVSITDNVDTLNESNKKSRQINGLVNEWYSEDISKAIRATFRMKREAGKFIGAFAPYGYMKDTNDNNRLVIDQEAARTIRMIYNWYLEGHGTQHITKMLNERKIPNPTKYKQEKGLKFNNSSNKNGYGLWNKTTIRRILKNQVYVGNTVQGKRKKVSYKSKKVINTPKESWVVVENTHKGIINKMDYDMVQDRLNKRVKSSGKGKAHIFASKVKCMDCGSSMIKVTSGNRYSYLRCSLYAKSPKKKLCTSHSIRLDALEDLVIEKLRFHLQKVDEDIIIKKLKVRGDENKEIDSLQRNLEIIERKIQAKQLIIKSLYEDKVKGIITTKQFAELNNSFNLDIQSLEERLDIVKEETVEKSNILNQISDYQDMFKAYKEVDGLNHVMVNSYIKSIEIGEKDKGKAEQAINIIWNF